jgi:hypothetical protein
MNDNSRSVEKLLAVLHPPEPPPGLQEKTLRGAREGLAREAGRDAWTRIWESRPLRVAWGLSVVVLVICNLGIGELRPARGVAGAPAARSARDGNGQIGLGRLPRLDENVRPLIGATTYRLIEQSEAGRGVPSDRKRKESAS